MAEKDGGLLGDSVRRKIAELKEVDILVGIPSYNNARTIPHVVRAVNAGLAKYYPDSKCVLVNSDGGSKDGTPDLVSHTEVGNLDMILVDHPVYLVSKIVTPYHGIPGKGSAFRTIFKIARELNAKACCVVDSDLRSITPEWIELLLDPIVDKGFEFVAPLYSRHKFDGTITNSIVYPMIRAMYGKRIRQPIGGEFGFSGKLAAHYLTKDVWESDVARYGIDIWMTTTAIGDGFKVCQSYLGAKIHDAKDPGADLTAMYIQVVSSLYTFLESYYNIWKKIKNSENIPTFGFKFEVGLEPVNVNIERMVNAFKLGIEALVPFLEKIITEQELKELQNLAKEDIKKFHFSDDLWVKLVYRYALAFHHRIWSTAQLMKSMIPLYLGRTASFVIENLDSTSEEVEAKIEMLCEQYERLKQLLIENWEKQKI
ncbi:MAG: glycosyl transferase family 2 [Bacteroides sp. SM1_62]|nr:MAG: glycosyl transferase family 2 [Bacteroides sp. SM23_62]KPL26728.1 MAG: glycosyl transferase family 2 [Bacteroides sp. SM1_62]